MCAQGGLRGVKRYEKNAKRNWIVRENIREGLSFVLTLEG